MTKRVSLTILMWLWSIANYTITDSAIAKAADVKTPEEKILSVEQIVNKTNHVAYYQGFDGRAKVKMTITDSQGRKRIREITILRWDQPGPNQPKKEQRKDRIFAVGRRFMPFLTDRQMYTKQFLWCGNIWVKMTTAGCTCPP